MNPPMNQFLRSYLWLLALSLNRPIYIHYLDRASFVSINAPWCPIHVLFSTIKYNPVYFTVCDSLIFTLVNTSLQVSSRTSSQHYCNDYGPTLIKKIITISQMVLTNTTSPQNSIFGNKTFMDIHLYWWNIVFLRVRDM